MPTSLGFFSYLWLFIFFSFLWLIFFQENLLKITIKSTIAAISQFSTFTGVLKIYQRFFFSSLLSKALKHELHPELQQGAFLPCTTIPKPSVIPSPGAFPCSAAPRGAPGEGLQHKGAAQVCLGQPGLGCTWRATKRKNATIGSFLLIFSTFPRHSGVGSILYHTWDLFCWPSDFRGDLNLADRDTLNSNNLVSQLDLLTPLSMEDFFFPFSWFMLKTVDL